MTIAVEDIEPELIKAIKRIAKNEGRTEKETMNNLLKKGIDASKNVSVQDIVSDNPKLKIMKKTKFNKNKNFEDMIGIVKAPEGFDPVEAVREVRRGD